VTCKTGQGLRKRSFAEVEHVRPETREPLCSAWYFRAFLLNFVVRLALTTLPIRLPQQSGEFEFRSRCGFSPVRRVSRPWERGAY